MGPTSPSPDLPDLQISMGFEEYNRTAMDHFLNPRNTGEVKDPDAAAFAENPLCGDLVKLTLRIRDGVIVEARAKTFGCAAAIASASAMTELLTGRSTEQAKTLRDADVVSHLGGLPEHKVKCSLVAERAVREALADFDRRSGR